MKEKHPQCDFCNEAIPLLYCRADSARLCLACDRSVHSDNQLFSKHRRSHLCNDCEANPASIFCSTHDLFLCQNCDWEAHDRAPSAHERRQLEGFAGCPLALEFASALGIEEKDLLDREECGNCVTEPVTDDGFLGGWNWETADPITSLDDLIVPTTSCHRFQAVEFPAPLKHRTVACGKYKEAFLEQLRNLAEKENYLKDETVKLDMVQGTQFWVQEQDVQGQNVSQECENGAVQKLGPGCESNAVPWHDNCNEPTDLHFSYKKFLESTTQEGSSVHEGCADIRFSDNPANEQKEKLHPKFEEISRSQSKVYELTGHDRDIVISRYKEKKKTRRYDKHIRYESRKARADSRTRIKGRFAKVDRDEKGDSVQRQV